MPDPDLGAAVARLAQFVAQADRMREAVRHHHYEPGEPQPPLAFHIAESDVEALGTVLAAVAWPTPPAPSAWAEDVEALIERLLSSPEERLDIARLKTSQITGWQVAKFHDGLQGFSNAGTLLAALRALAAQHDGQEEVSNDA